MARNAEAESEAMPFSTEENWDDSHHEIQAREGEESSTGTYYQNDSGDVFQMIQDMQHTLTKQNNTILSQIRNISSDINQIKKDLSKVTSIVSKSEINRERDNYAANILQCEFKTFSSKVNSLLQSLEGKKEPSEFVNGQWNEYFHGEDNVLSNFYKSSIHLGGLTFKTAEHLYQYKKAEYHGMEDGIGSKILNASYGGAAKSIGSRNIQVCDDWEEEKADIMLEVLRSKAKQCDEFREHLLASGGCGLIHDLPNHLWGWGTHGLGLNLMGRLLEKLREEIQNSPETFENDSEKQEFDRQDVSGKSVGQETEEDTSERRHTSENRESKEISEHRNEKYENKNRMNTSKKRREAETPSKDHEKMDDPTYVEEFPELPQPGSRAEQRTSERQVTSSGDGGSIMVKVGSNDRKPQRHQRTNVQRHGSREENRSVSDEYPEMAETDRDKKSNFGGTDRNYAQQHQQRARMQRYNSRENKRPTNEGYPYREDTDEERKSNRGGTDAYSAPAPHKRSTQKHDSREDRRPKNKDSAYVEDHESKESWSHDKHESWSGEDRRGRGERNTRRSSRGWGRGSGRGYSQRGHSRPQRSRYNDDQGYEQNCRSSGRGSAGNYDNRLYSDHEQARRPDSQNYRRNDYSEDHGSNYNHQRENHGSSREQEYNTERVAPDQPSGKGRAITGEREKASSPPDRQVSVGESADQCQVTLEVHQHGKETPE